MYRVMKAQCMYKNSVLTPIRVLAGSVDLGQRRLKPLNREKIIPLNGNLDWEESPERCREVRFGLRRKSDRQNS